LNLLNPLSIVNRSSHFLLFLSIPLAIILFSGCKSTEFTGYSYDPEGVTITTDKPMDPQPKRTIGFREDSVWFSNEFTGARMSDVIRLAPNSYQVTVQPENEPINNSPWYAFEVQANREKEIQIQLIYPGFRHRYPPKLSGPAGEPVGDAFLDGVDSIATYSLLVGPDPVYFSAQELFTTAHAEEWLTGEATKPNARRSVIGQSKQGRDLHLLEVNYPAAVLGETPASAIASTSSVSSREKGVVIIVGRQHPPEIPGYLTMLKFVERLTAMDDPLSAEFLSRFDLWVVPIMNPDGVDEGHWRHNAGGIDLNRDWRFFNQPETRSVSEALLRLKEEGRKVWYGLDFHSTNENIFYPIERTEMVFPEDFTYEWLDAFRAAEPGLPFSIEPFDTSSPIAKNWIWSTFGADAVTFEVDDAAPREALRQYADRAAETMMELLIEKFDGLN